MSLQYGCVRSIVCSVPTPEFGLGTLCKKFHMRLFTSCSYGEVNSKVLIPHTIVGIPRKQNLIESGCATAGALLGVATNCQSGRSSTLKDIVLWNMAVQNLC